MSDSDSRAYRILRWERFEKQRQRDDIKNPTWISWGNRLDGDTYIELVSGENGAARLGVYVALCMVASMCNAHGLLVREDATPHTAESLANKTRLSVEIMQEALAYFEKTGKIDTVALMQSGAPKHAAKRVNGSAPSEILSAASGNDGFENWWLLWCQATNRSAGEYAAREKWFAHIKPDAPPELLAAVAACSQSYFQSREVANHRVTTAARFIEAQSKEGWRARWPSAAEPPAKPTVAETVKELAQKRIASGRKPM